MILKVIEKNGKKYYILSICDAKTKEWASTFVSEKIYSMLVCNGVKVSK